MKEALIEISNENLTKWRKRRKTECEKKEKIDELETESLVKWRKKIKCNYEKKKNERILKEKGKLPFEKKSVEWINLRKNYWRNHRERDDISPVKSFVHTLNRVN